MIGAGDLGSAISHYRGFVDRGFEIAWVFDADPEKVGTQMGQYIVLPMSDLEKTLADNHCQIAMLAVPAKYAQDVANTLVEAGIKAILNYAPINLTVPEGVMVQYIDPVVHMQHMTYYLDDEK